VRWISKVADLRVHGTTGEAPQQRLERAETQTLQPLPDKPSFLAVLELVRFLQGLQALWPRAGLYRKSPSRGRAAAAACIPLRPMPILSPNGLKQRQM
jgi:hypothetical protein